MFVTLFLYICGLLDVPFIDGDIKLDGKLDDPWYAVACKVTEFTQISPVVGSAPRESTIVYILQNDRGLYFGLYCETKHRKPDLSPSGDQVSVYLDTYFDRKTAYLFTVLANGTRMEARITQNGENLDYDFETIWYCATYTADSFYSVEIFIPWKGLMGKPGPWGINIKRESPPDYMVSMVVYDPNKQPLRVSDFKVMKDIKFSAEKPVLEIQPILNIIHGTDFDEHFRYKVEFGGNLYLRIRKNMKFSLTYKPDFAEIEADPYRLNLSKYALFYPEKRPFFIEGREFFSFNMPDRLKIFYSRQIGKTLLTGKIVPIIFGMKDFMKFRHVELSSLWVRTDSARDAFSYEPVTDFVVNKIRMLPNEAFSFCLMDARRFMKGVQSKGLTGVELLYQTESILAGIEYIKDNIRSKEHAMQLQLHRWFNGLSISCSMTDISDGFSDNGVGYIPWKGLHREKASIQYVYRFDSRYRLYYASGKLSVTRKRELDEPFTWVSTLSLSLYFTSNVFVGGIFSYGKEYELNELFNAPSFTIFLAYNTTHVNCKSVFYFYRTYNYLRGYVGNVRFIQCEATLTYKRMMAILWIYRWDEFDPQNKLASTTYSIRALAAATITPILSMSFYVDLPYSGRLLSKRVGCHVTIRFGGKGWSKCVHNYYSSHTEEGWQTYIRKSQMKLRPSWVITL